MTRQGKVIADRYEVLEPVGQGAIATVFRARELESGVLRAIKCLRTTLRPTDKVRARFRQEAETLSQLDHPHIVRIFDHGEDESTIWIVMELVEGRSLHDWKKCYGAMSGTVAVEAILDVCAAIVVAHEQGVIHRDIKPHNILVEAGDRCKVVDFGIARFLGGDESLTRTGVTMGTWGYMAPEQESDAKNVDERADVHGIGATLLSMLIGEDVVNPRELLEQQNDRIPDALRWPLTRALMADPNHRYPSVARLARVLVRTRDELPPSPDGLVSLHMPLGAVSLS